MPRYNVQNPITKKWRCFSSIVDDWASEWMDEKSYEEWRKQEYGTVYCPVREANQMTLEDAERAIKNREEQEDE